MTQDQAREMLISQLTCSAVQFGRRYCEISQELNAMRMNGELDFSRFPEPLRTAVKLTLADRGVFDPRTPTEREEDEQFEREQREGGEVAIIV